MKKVLEKSDYLLYVTALICVLISSLFPLYTLNRFNIIDNKLTGLVFLVLTILGVVLYKLYKKPLFILLFIFTAFMCITAFLECFDLTHSFGGSYQRIWYMYLMAMLVGFLLKDKTRVRWITIMFSLFIVITSVCYVIFLVNAISGLFDPLAKTSMKWGIFRLGRLHAFSNANTLGIYAVASVLETFWLFIFFTKSKIKLRRVICSICIILGCFAFLILGLCRSRGSILAASAGIGAMCFLIFRKNKAFFRPFLAACAGAFLSLVLCLGSQKLFDLAVISVESENMSADEIEEAITPVALDYALDTLSDRTLIWSATIRMLNEEPVRWLTGITAADVHNNQIYDVYEGRPELTAVYAHSGYVEVLLVHGLPGVCLLLIFLIEVIISCFRIGFSNDNIPLQDKLVLGFIAAGLVLGVVEVLPFPYLSAFILSYLFFFASGCCFSLLKNTPTPKWLKVLRPILYGCILIGTIVLCISKLNIGSDTSESAEGTDRISYFNEKNRKSISVNYIDFALEDIADIFNGNVLTSLISETAPVGSCDNIDMNIPRTVDCRFGISVTRSNMYKLPVSSDNEELLQSDVLPFTPFIELYDSVDGEWTYALTYGYGGWIRKDSIALCKSKAEWLERIHPKDFLVVTDYDIHLDGTPFADISIPMGTMLPLSDAQGSASSRVSYLVTLPTRDKSGLIYDIDVEVPASDSVSHGYVQYTEENMLSLALKHEGHTYGIAGSDNSFDCSGMTKSIYACFGLSLPRTAVAQSKVDVAEIYNVHNDFGLGKVLNIGHNTTEYKMKVLENAPVGTLLYFPGHIMLYLGMEEGHPVCISAVADYSTKDLPVGTIESINKTVVTDMTYVTRADGKTWLESLEKIIIIK